MKRGLVLFISTVVLLCLSNSIYSQNNYFSPCGNVIAGDDCAQAGAPSICELDGFSTSSGGVTADLGCVLDGAFCGPGGVAHNNMWIGFQIAPGETSVQFAIDVQGCNSGNGLQASIIALDDCSCDGNLTPISCVNCVSNDFELSAFNLQENTNYYIMIDGCNADDCDFVVNVINGLPDVNVNISSITSFPLCEDNDDCSSTTTLSATASPGNPNSFVYDWYNTATGALVGSGRFLEVSGCVGDEYTVRARRPSDCCPTEGETSLTLAAPSQRATAVLNNTPESITIDCSSNLSELTLDATGSSSSNNHVFGWALPNGNSIVGSGLKVSIPVDELVEGTYTFTTYHEQTFCLAEVEVDVTLNTDKPEAIALDGQITCTPGQDKFLMDGSNSRDYSGFTSGNNMTYQWLDDQGNELSTANMHEVSTPGVYTLVVTDTRNGCTHSLDVNVVSTAQYPTADAGTGSILGCTPNTALLDGTQSSSGNQFNYQWTGPGTISNPNIANPTTNAAGTYTLIVTNTTNNCSSTAQVEVTANNTPPAVATSVSGSLSCADQTVTLSSAGSSSGTGYTYDWTGPGINNINASSPSPSVSLGGTYILEVTAPNGCTNTSSIEVEGSSTEPTADAGSDQTVTCNNNGMATLNGSGVAGNGDPLSYEWTRNGVVVSNSQSFQTNQQGQFTLTVTNTANGCTDTDQLFVSLDNQTPTLSVGSNTQNNTTNFDCYNNGNLQLVATASAQNNPSFSYTWNGNPSGATFTAGSAGPYTVIVTNNNNGCTAIENINVTDDRTPPQVQAASPGTITCIDTEVDLIGNGSSTGAGGIITYQWTGPGNISNPSALNPTTDAGGNYTLVVTNTTNGCTNSATTNIDEEKNLPTAIIDSSDPFNNLNCANNSSLDLTGSGQNGTNYTYRWLQSSFFGDFEVGSGSNFPATTAGTYILEVTNSDNGCTDTETIDVGFNFEEPDAQTNTPDELTCINTSSVLDASASTGTGLGTLSYSWSGPGFNSTQVNPTVTDGGQYSVTVTDSYNGCTRKTDINVNEDKDLPNATAVATATITCNDNMEVILDATGSDSGNHTYAWNGTASGETTTTPTVNIPGTYTITVTDSDNGCTNTADVVVDQNTIAPQNVVADSGSGIITCTEGELDLAGSTTTTNPVNYEWSIGNSQVSTQQMLSVSEAGTYTLVVTDQTNGCTTEVSTMVENDAGVPTGPTFTYDGLAILNCSQPDFDITGMHEDAAIELSWVGPNTNTPDDIINISEGGMYDLIATDPSNGCSSTSSITVSEDFTDPVIDNIAATNNATITCDDPSLDLSITTEDDNLQYDWAGPDITAGLNENSQIPTVTIGGSYSIIVTAQNGCTDIANIDVVQDDAAPGISLVSASVTTLTCDEPSIQLNGSSPTAGVDYLWSTTDNASNITVTDPAVYTLLVENPSNGCTSEEMITIDEDKVAPMITANGETLTCANPEVQLTATADLPDVTYTWSGAGYNGNDQNPTTLESGVYSLVVENNTNGCTTNTMYEVIENTTLPNISATGADLTCTDPQAPVLGSSTTPNANFQWYSGADTSGSFAGNADETNPEVGAPGDYTLLVTDPQNGCTATQTITVTQTADLPAIATSTSDTELNCDIETITLDGTGSATGGDFTYQWTGTTFSSNDLIVDITEPDTYTLQISNNATGCTSTSDVVIPQNITAPTADAGADDFYKCNTPTLNLNAGASTGQGTLSYEWSAGLGNAQIATVSGPGTYTLTVTDAANNCTAIDEVFIEDDTAIPTAAIADPIILTCTDVIADLDASASTSANGDALTYEWNDPSLSTNDMVGVDAPGAYIVTVTDTNNGCTDTATIQVDQDIAEPALEVAPADIITCTSPTIMLDATNSDNGANYAYAWTGPGVESGATTLTPTVNADGTYTLEITAPNGCSDVITADVQIDQVNPAVAIANITPTITCAEPIITLDGAGSETGVNITYVWDTNDNTLTTDVSTPGTYALLVTNETNGCTDEASIEVMENTTAPTANAGNDNTFFCSTMSLELDASASVGQGNLSYEWSNNLGTNATATAMQANTYTVTVTDALNGCTAEDSVDIIPDQNAPTALIAPANTITCNEPMIDLDASISTDVNGNNNTLAYEWSTTATDALIMVGESILYEVTVTDTNNGCTSVASLQVDQDIAEPALEVAPADIITCTSPTIMLDATNSDNGANYAYAWTGPGVESGATTLTPTVNADGTYTLEITAPNGCSDVITADVQIDQVNPAVAIANITPTITCAEPIITLDGAGSETGADITYVWDTNDNTLTTDVSTPGTYALLVTNQTNGCTDEASIEVMENTTAPTANAGNDDTFFCGTMSIALDASSSLGQGNLSYQWSDNLGTNANATATESGTYTVVVTDAINGCTDMDEVDLLLDQNNPIAVIATPNIITCNDPMVNLDGSASSDINGNTNTLTYEWSTTDTDASIMVGQSITYMLTVTDINNNCTDTAMMAVDEDTALPSVAIETPAILTCGVLEVDLDGANSDNGANYAYEWTTTNGNITSGATTLAPTIDEIGDYTLVITAPNGCTDQAVTTVDEDVAIPAVTIANITPTITCTEPIITLDGAGSETGADITYAWDTNDNTLTTDVSTPGMYTLLVTNETNACTDEATIEVAQNITAPTASAVAADGGVFLCSTTEIELDASSSAGQGNLSYAWSDNLGMASTANATDDGTYTVTVTDAANGCTADTSVEIVPDENAPTAVIAMPNIITCNEPSVSLDASASTANNGTNVLDYQWSTFAGGDMISVNQPLTYMVTVTDTGNGCTNVASMEVLEDTAPPAVAIDAAALLTCADLTVDLDGTNSDNGTGYTYLWMGPGNITDETTLTPTVDAIGEYILEVTAPNGCIAQNNIIVDEDVTPPVVATNTTILTCANETIDIDGTGSDTGANFTYEWTDPNGNVIGNNLIEQTSTQGTHTLSILNTVNGCQESMFLDVPQDIMLPLADAGMDVDFECTTTTLGLDASNSSGQATLSYAWNAGLGNAATASVNSPGTYEVTVTDSQNGCTNTDQIEVIDDRIDPTAAIAMPATLTCAVLTSTLDGITSNSNNNGNLTYEWLAGSNVIDTNAELEVSNPGIYTLIVTDDTNGCTNSATMEVMEDVELPNVEIAEAAIITCYEETVTLDGTASDNGADYSYEWTIFGANGNIIAGINDLTATVDAAGAYTLTVINNINGCEDEAMIPVMANIEEPTIAADAATEFTCTDTEVSVVGTISAGSGTVYDYSWMSLLADGSGIISGVTDPSILVDMPGEYQLMVTDVENGCTSVALVDVPENDSIIEAIDLNAIDESCYEYENGQIVIDEPLTGTEPFMYSIDGGETFGQNNNFGLLPPGEYNIVVQDLEGCEKDSIIVIDAAAQLSDDFLGEDQTITLGDSTSINIDLEMNVDVMWTDSLQGTNPMIEPVVTSTYGATIMTENGCESSDDITIFVDKNRPVFIPSGFSPNGDGTNDVFMIFGSDAVESVESFQVYDRWGELIFSQKDFPAGNSRFGWDGNFNNKLLKPAVFIYVAKIKFVDDVTEVFTGDISLMR